jgi:hypothetical protein
VGGWAEADGLLDASVHVFDWAHGQPASADAKVYDTLTFHVAGATSSTVTDIAVQLDTQSDWDYWGDSILH